jgi:hypothetical protein
MQGACGKQGHLRRFEEEQRWCVPQDQREKRKWQKYCPHACLWDCQTQGRPGRSFQGELEIEGRQVDLLDPIFVVYQSATSS